MRNEEERTADGRERTAHKDERIEQHETTQQRGGPVKVVNSGYIASKPTSRGLYIHDSDASTPLHRLSVDADLAKAAGWIYPEGEGTGEQGGSCQVTKSRVGGSCLSSLERIAGLQERMANVEKRMANLEERMVNGEERMASLEGHMASVQEQQLQPLELQKLQEVEVAAKTAPTVITATRCRGNKKPPELRV